VQIAQTKYKVGDRLQQDVLLAQVELSQLLDRGIQLRTARHNTAARLNALLAKPVTDSVDLPPGSGGRLPDLCPDETLIRIAEKSWPRLAELTSQVKAASTRVDLARRDLLPDFQLGVAYAFRNRENPDGRSRPDFLSLQLKMSVPLVFSPPFCIGLRSDSENRAASCCRQCFRASPQRRWGSLPG
jgi:cobalt-zinc-cadmium efflux system outer membrane protein